MVNFFETSLVICHETLVCSHASSISCGLQFGKSCSWQQKALQLDIVKIKKLLPVAFIWIEFLVIKRMLRKHGILRRLLMEYERFALFVK